MPTGRRSARDADEGRSVYAGSGGSTRIGERLSELPLTLRSDPDEPGLELCAVRGRDRVRPASSRSSTTGCPLDSYRLDHQRRAVRAHPTRSWAAANRRAGRVRSSTT